jgi:hypothetical protein
MGWGTKPTKESFSEMRDRWRASAREEDPSLFYACCVEFQVYAHFDPSWAGPIKVHVSCFFRFWEPSRHSGRVFYRFWPVFRFSLLFLFSVLFFIFVFRIWTDFAKLNYFQKSNRFQILNIFKFEQFQNWTNLNLNIFEFEQFWIWTFSNLNNFGFEHFQIWTILILNISDFEHILNWTNFWICT